MSRPGDSELKRSLLEACHRIFDARDKDTHLEGAAALELSFRAWLDRHDLDREQVERYIRSLPHGFRTSVVRQAAGDPFLSAITWERRPRYPRLLTFGSGITLLDVIKAELDEPATESAWIASAFCTRGMLNLLMDPLSRFVRRGRKLRLLTSVMDDFNDPDDLRHVKDRIPELDIRVYYPLSDGMRNFRKAPPPFHLKCFLFEKLDGAHALVVGSSNLTVGGLLRNHEWNYFTNSEGNLRFRGHSSAFEQGREELRRYWEEDAVDASDSAFFEAYRKRYLHSREARRELAERLKRERAPAAPEPRPAQAEALSSLAARRAAGVSKSAVIAATGMGKTFLAAFDYRASGRGSLLFLAHRENILTKARDIFRQVLDDPDFGAILSGREKPADAAGARGLFAMVQTISNETTLSSFAPDRFEYVVVDEFHHAEAVSWLRVIERIKPRFLLALTATPERMDGRDVLRLCDYNIAHETRLFDAIDRGWLTPFQYYAIYDETDYERIAWRGRYAEEDLDGLLIDDTRAEIVANNLRRYLPSAGKVKALAFCASRNHARYMARRFNEEGLCAECVTGHTPVPEREETIRRLQDESDPLQVVCSVDVFGEGVDIPSVTHVLFLRPTESFTVFLQQLGRGLRLVPEKEFLVALDFVGNFRQSYIAPLALRGYHSIEEYIADRQKQRVRELPSACHVSADLEVTRIWEKELRDLLRPANRAERLKAQYREFRENLDHSPTLMDFFANPAAPDPHAFIRYFGNWLRTKAEMKDIEEYEMSLLATPGEALLQHVEKDLSPSKSYKMVVLHALLDLGETEWDIAAIARKFLDWYLADPERRSDWDELARAADPHNFPLDRAARHLVNMPLGKMAGTGEKFFELDRARLRFAIRMNYRGYWGDPRFRELLDDRVRYALARYFYRQEAETDIPFATVRSAYADTLTKTVTENREAIMGGEKVTFEAGEKGGYPGDMTVTLLPDNNQTFKAKWSNQDITRFPARIKAVATGLTRIGCYGKFRIMHHAGKLTIKKI